MIEHPFQVLGRHTPALLGRKKVLEQMGRALTAKSPPHISVLGPKLVGKTVLLSHLAKVYGNGARGFLASAYLDFRHDTPRNDRDLLVYLAKATKSSLERAQSPLADLIDLNDTDLIESLSLTFEDMGEIDQKFLLVMDGFDHILAVDGISRSMWNALRTLGHTTDSLVYVTGSRRSLEQLCRSEESRTSDFWTMFRSNPVMIDCFDTDDWTSLLEPFELQGIQLSEGARKELVNWSGGVPVLSMALLAEVAQLSEPDCRVEKPVIDAAAEIVIGSQGQLLSALFFDCDVDLQSDLETLAREQPNGVPSSTLPSSRTDELGVRGYAKKIGSRVKPSCRCMEVFVSQRDPSASDLKRLFGTAEGFVQHGQSLLELRLSQVIDGTTDSVLRQYLSSAIRQFGEEPENSIMFARVIVERVLALIWEKELPENPVIPEQWISEWSNAEERTWWLNKKKELPHKTGIQVIVLRLATGSENSKPVAKWVSRDTYILLSYLHSIAAFALHREKNPTAEVTFMFAFLAMLCSIELVDAWQRNIQKVRAGAADETGMVQ